MLKRLPSIQKKSLISSFQTCSSMRSHNATSRLPLTQNSFTFSNTFITHSIITNLRCIRHFAAQPGSTTTKKPTPEKKNADDNNSADEEENLELEEGVPEEMNKGDEEEFNAMYDEVPADTWEQEGRVSKKTKFVFEDPNIEQRKESWKFLKPPNEGFTTNYKKIKAAYIGLPEPEMAETLPLPPNYRNKSGITTKQGRVLPQFVDDFKVPEPRFGINVENFLNKIGKDCGKYADKFKSWDELMTFKRKQLKKLEIPIKQRKWIRGWVEKYRRGIEPYSIRMKSIAKRNKEKKKEQVDAFKAIMKPKKERTKVHRQTTAPLRLEKKKLIRKIAKLTRTIDMAELKAQDELAV